MSSGDIDQLVRGHIGPSESVAQEQYIHQVVVQPTLDINADVPARLHRDRHSRRHQNGPSSAFTFSLRHLPDGVLEFGQEIELILRRRISIEVRAKEHGIAEIIDLHAIYVVALANFFRDAKEIIPDFPLLKIERGPPIPRRGLRILFRVPGDTHQELRVPALPHGQQVIPLRNTVVGVVDAVRPEDLQPGLVGPLNRCAELIEARLAQDRHILPPPIGLHASLPKGVHQIVVPFRHIGVMTVNKGDAGAV